MSLIGYVVAIPVFCDAAFILLSPLTKSLSKNARVSGKALTVALSTGLFAPHMLIPPTPGPLAAAATLGLNELGMLIIAGGVLSLVLVLAGGWFATRMNKQLSTMEAIESMELPVVRGGFWKAILPLLLPLILIAGGTSFRDIQGPIQPWITTLSKPEVALAMGVVIALLISGNKMKEQSWVKNALRAGGPVLLITAMGGALGGVLKLIDIGAMLEGIAEPALLPWFALRDFGGTEIGTGQLDRCYHYHGINDVAHLGTPWTGI